MAQDRHFDIKYYKGLIFALIEFLLPFPLVFLVHTPQVSLFWECDTKLYLWKYIKHHISISAILWDSQQKLFGIWRQYFLNFSWIYLIIEVFVMIVLFFIRFLVEISDDISALEVSICKSSFSFASPLVIKPNDLHPRIGFLWCPLCVFMKCVDTHFNCVRRWQIKRSFTFKIQKRIYLYLYRLCN